METGLKQKKDYSLKGECKKQWRLRLGLKPASILVVLCVLHAILRVLTDLQIPEQNFFFSQNRPSYTHCPL